MGFVKSNKTMSNFKERLLAEKAELNEKIAKLDDFQNSDEFQNIEPFQMSLLNIQSQAMATYSQCLVERVAWLEKELAAPSA